MIHEAVCCAPSVDAASRRFANVEELHEPTASGTRYPGQPVGGEYARVSLAWWGHVARTEGEPHTAPLVKTLVINKIRAEGKT